MSTTTTKTESLEVGSTATHAQTTPESEVSDSNCSVTSSSSAQHDSQGVSKNASSKPQKKIHFRRAHKKSHLGCANCKKRRIKCDEKLPICGHCIKSRAQCSYLTAPPGKLLIEKMRQSGADHSQQMHHGQIHPVAVGAAGAAPNSVSPGHSPGSVHMNIDQSARHPLDHPQLLPQPGLAYPPPHSYGAPVYGYPQQQHQQSRENDVKHPHQNSQYAYGYHPRGPPMLQVPTQNQNPNGGAYNQQQQPPPPPPPQVYSYQMLNPPSSLPHLPQPNHPSNQYGSLPLLHTSSPLQAPQSHGFNPSSLRSNVFQRPFASQTSYGLPPIQPILNETNSPSPGTSSSQSQSLSPLNANSLPSLPSMGASVTPSSNPSVSNGSVSSLTSTSAKTESSTPVPQDTDLTSVTNESSSGFSTTSTRSSESTNSLVRQGFETDLMRSVYFEWISSVFALACESPSLYHSLMSLSYGILSVKMGGGSDNVVNSSLFTRESTKHRFVALQGIQEQLKRDPNDNKPLANSPESLLSSALMLSWDVFFQQEDIGSYVTLCKGFVAVLEKALATQATNPDPAAVCMKDSVFQGIRCILVPAYNRDVLEEAIEVVEGLKDYFYNAPQKTDLLKREFDELVSFLRNVSCYLLTSKRIHDSKGLEYFSPSYLFSLLRKWIIMFPCGALAMGSVNKANTMTEQELVLYTYYHCFTRLLDALFPEVRYLFQFGFIGPVDLVGVENVLKTTCVDIPDKLIDYPRTVVTFFRERSFHYNRLVGSRNPFEMSNKSLFIETQIKSFRNTVIGAEHFPRLPEDYKPEDEITDPKDAAAAEAQIFQYYFADRLKVLASIE